MSFSFRLSEVRHICFFSLLLLATYIGIVSAETGMCLVASRSGGGYSDYIDGTIRRIDLIDNVVQTATASLGTGCWPRFAPSGDQFAYMDGDSVRICTVSGGRVRSFRSENSGNISWTVSGIWVSGNGRITKYDTNGVYVRRYTSGVVQRNYVSQNEITGSGVAEGDWHPVIYNIRRNATVLPSAPPGAWTAGCSACPSPDGLRVTNNLVENTVQPSNPAEVHRSMRILDTLGNMLLYLRLENITKFTAAGYRWDTQCWSSNSNDWIVIPVGQGSNVADQNVSACVYNLATQQKVCFKDNTGTSNYWQPYDYFSGKAPGSAASLQLSPQSLAFAADSAGPAPTAQTITASTASGTLSGLTVSGQPSWLTVTPSSGSGASIALSNLVSTGTLAVGTYVDTITVTTSNAGSRTFIVSLTIRRPAITQTLSAFDITPPVFTVVTGGAVAFLATARDQTGAIMRGVSVSWNVSGGGAISATGVFTAGNTVGGAHRITATAVSGAITLRDTAWVSVSNISATHRKINCGDNSITVAGWERDDSYVSGGSDWLNPGTVATAGVAAAAPADIYRSVRSGSPHSYAFGGLTPSWYTVRVHLADAFDSAQYQRRMSYTVAGVNVVRDFSIVRLAGGANRALAVDFPADMRAGGALSVQCEGLTGSDVFEAGLELLEHRLSAITLISHNGGETVAVGQSVPVRWYVDTLRSRQVLIELSVDNGESYGLISGNQGIVYAPGSAQWGLFTWTVPSSINAGGVITPTVSTQCRIQVRPYLLDPGVSPAVSIGTFTITGAGAVRTTVSAHTRETYISARARAGVLHVRASANQPYTVNVFSLDGSVVWSASGVGGQTWDIAGLAKGVRPVRMVLADGRVLNGMVAR